MHKKQTHAWNCFSDILKKWNYPLFQENPNATRSILLILFSQKGLPKATAAGLRGNIRNTDKGQEAHLRSRMETDVQPILKIMVSPQGHPCSMLTKNLTSPSWKLFYLSFCNLRQFSLWCYCQQPSTVCSTIRITHPSTPLWTCFWINVFPTCSFM